MKIKNQLIMGFAGFFLFTLLMGAAGSYYAEKGKKILQDIIQKEFIRFGVSELDDMYKSIYLRIEGLEIYAQETLIKESLERSDREFETYGNISSYISQNDWHWTPSQDIGTIPLMETIIGNPVSYKLRKMTGLLRKKYGYDVFGEVFITNKYGVNIGQTGGTSDYYQADEKWWQETEKKGVYLGKVGYDESSEVYSIEMGIKIKDEDGTFLGVLKAVYNLKSIINRVSRLKDTAGFKITSFSLLTQDGRNIYSSIKDEFLGETTYTFVPDLPDGWAPFVELTKDKDGAHQEKMLVVVHSDGYMDFKGLGWVLIVEREIGELFVPVIKLRNSLFLFSFMVMMFGALLAFFVIRSVLGSMSKLGKKMMDISENVMKQKIQIQMEYDIDNIDLFVGEISRKLEDSLKREKENTAAALRMESEKKRADELLELNQKLKEREMELYKMNEELASSEKALKESKGILEKRVDDLTKFHKVTVGREQKMVELKSRINELLKELGRGQEEMEEDKE